MSGCWQECLLFCRQSFSTLRYQRIPKRRVLALTHLPTPRSQFLNDCYLCKIHLFILCLYTFYMKLNLFANNATWLVADHIFTNLIDLWFSTTFHIIWFTGKYDWCWNLESVHWSLTLSKSSYPQIYLNRHFYIFIHYNCNLIM